MQELTTAIAGIDFPNPDRSRSNRRMEILLTAPGDPVELRAEPKNPHDANAVAIWSERGVQMGYVPAERAPLIGKSVRQGRVNAVFQAFDGARAYIRIRLDGGAPTLPAASPSLARQADGPGDFQADDDGPEWGA